MLRPGSVFDGRFRVLENFAAAANSIALAEELNGGRRVWLALLSLTATAAQVTVALERHSRFALGLPGLARPLAAGVDGELVFVAFAAPESGSVAAAHVAAWEVLRVAALAERIARALGPLHDQGIAHGSLRPEWIAESEHGDVLFGFGVAELATRFGAPGEASQLLAPSYRAPELRSALLPPSPQSDVFALGVLLRELLCAPETTAKDQLGATPALPAALAELLARATASEARARPSDVRAFAAELNRVARAEAASPAAIGIEPAASAPSPEPTFEGASEPVPPSPPEPVAPPAPPPFALPPTSPQATSRSGNWLVLLIVIGGFVLMNGSVIAAMLFAVHRARPTKALARTPTPHRLPPSAPGPRLTVPGPSDDELPPLAPAPTLPKKKPAPARAPIRHAPLLPPGVGPSTFPEDARSLLPVSGSEPIWGTRNAPLTWVIFGDLECPHTRHAWRALEAAKVVFGDDLRIVFRHRPLREHPYAARAARVLAGLARERGASAFFTVLHEITEDEVALTDDRLLADLSAVGFGNLPLSELASAGDSTVLGDLALAGQFGVRSTPLSFVNGARVEGERTPDELERLLLDERRSATWVLASGALAKDLYVTRTSANLIGLGEQETSRVCVPVSDAPSRGPADALVTLVEFSDFECPYCKQVEPALKTLLARYPKTLRLVWKDYPLPQHKSARLLANFAADAATRGANAGFWAVHDGLFATAGAVDDGVLGELAGKAGLDGAPLLVAAHAGAHETAIRADIALGERLGVNGTPTFFANGRRIQGALGLDQFDALIRAELSSAQRIVSHGVARDKLYGLVCDAE